MKDSKRRSEYQIEGDGISEVKKAKLTPDNEKGNNILEHASKQAFLDVL